MQQNPYQPPTADVSENVATHWVYAGFWIRVLAAVIDSILIMAVTYPILIAIYGTSYFTTAQVAQGPLDLFLSWIFPALAVLIFWHYRSATPGKMVLQLVILDSRNGTRPTTGQYLLRYLGYYLASIPLLLGIIWVAFDPRKQGWHDKIANTVVVRILRGNADAIDLSDR